MRHTVLVVSSAHQGLVLFKAVWTRLCLDVLAGPQVTLGGAVCRLVAAEVIYTLERCNVKL